MRAKGHKAPSGSTSTGNKQPMAEQFFQPSDVMKSAVDEIGAVLTAIRAQAMSGTNEERDSLKELYKQIMQKYQLLIFRDLKTMDDDPEILANIAKLTAVTQSLAKVKREMVNAKEAVDRAIKVLGYADELLGFLAKLA
jgi:hypothetical protein